MNGGCSYYRILAPLNKLQEVAGDFVEVRFDQNPLDVQIEKKQFNPDHKFENMNWADIVMVSNISNYGGPYTARVVQEALARGKFAHFDTDDLLTDLYKEHRLYKVYKDNQLDEITKFVYNNSHLVSVTQDAFAREIQQFTRGGLAVIRNAIDYKLPGWNAPKVKTKQVKIGWAGGIHHRPDVKVFAGVPNLVNSKAGKENIIWDFYGHPPANNPPEEKWQEDAWKEYLSSFVRGNNSKNFRVHYALGPDGYGVFYANMDIAIAPLASNRFNEMKCLDGLTQVEKGKTFPFLKDIKIGDKIKSPKGMVTVLDKMCYKKEALKIITKDGHSLIGSLDHRIETYKGLVELSSLCVGDGLEVGGWVDEIYKKIPMGKRDLYDIEVDHPSHLFYANGFISHNSDVKVAEAACYGVPLVATDVGCYRDTIINGKTGYLLPPGSSPIEWSKVISRLVKDKDLREEMGNNLKKIKDSYDLNKVVWDRLWLYEKAIDDFKWNFKFEGKDN